MGGKEYDINNNNIYLSIIKILLKKDLYSKYGIVIEELTSDTPDLERIVLCLKDYYSSSNNDIGSIDNLELFFFSSYPSLRPKEQESFHLLFQRLREVDASVEFIDQYLAEIRRQKIANEIAIKSLDLSAGKGTIAEIDALVQELKADHPTTTTEIEFITDDLNELLDQQFSKPGLRWRLDCLNKSLGSLRKGDFGFIFKRPETGGTTFLASEVSFMAAQVDRPILWFNNEEQSSKVKIRCYQAALGCKIDSLHKDRVSSITEYQGVTRGNIKIPPDGSFDTDLVERYCVEHNPSLILFDQIDKIKGFKKSDDRKDLELGAIYQWARELAKTYAPVIGVCQASGSAEDKMWLTMDDVAESKTSKQAEADWIIGIGKVHDQNKKNFRYFNICKNKLLGDQDSYPELRHGQLTVLIRPEVARYEDLEKF